MEIDIDFEIDKMLDKEKWETDDSMNDIVDIIFNNTNTDNGIEVDTFNSEQANCLFSILGDD